MTTAFFGDFPEYVNSKVDDDVELQPEPSDEPEELKVVPQQERTQPFLWLLGFRAGGC